MTDQAPPRLLGEHESIHQMRERADDEGILLDEEEVQQ